MRFPLPNVHPVMYWMASTPHMSVSTMATTSSSTECGPTRASATSAARMPRARPGHMWPWKLTTCSTVSRLVMISAFPSDAQPILSLAVRAGALVLR